MGHLLLLPEFVTTGGLVSFLLTFSLWVERKKLKTEGSTEPETQNLKTTCSYSAVGILVCCLFNSLWTCRWHKRECNFTDLCCHYGRSSRTAPAIHSSRVINSSIAALNHQQQWYIQQPYWRLSCIGGLNCISKVWKCCIFAVLYVNFQYPDPLLMNQKD